MRTIRPWLSALVCTALLVPAAARADDRIPATLVGTAPSVFNPSLGAFVGPGVLTVNGQQYGVLGAGTLLGIVSADPATGVLVAALSHHFTALDPADDIEFWTLDNAVLTPIGPGVYSIYNQSEIAVGNGRFKAGHFTLLGQVDFITGTAQTTSGEGWISEGGHAGTCRLGEIAGQGAFDPAAQTFSLAGTIAIDGGTRAVAFESTALIQGPTLPGGILTFTGEHAVKTQDPGPQIEFHTNDRIALVPTATAGVYSMYAQMFIPEGPFTLGEIVLSGATVDLNARTVVVQGALGRICQ